MAMVYNHRILSNDHVEYEFGTGQYRQTFGPKDVEAVAAYWQKLFTDKSDGRTQYDVYGKWIYYNFLYRGVGLIRTMEIAKKSCELAHSYELAPPCKSKF